MLRQSRFGLSLVLLISVSVLGAGCAPKNKGKATQNKTTQTEPPAKSDSPGKSDSPAQNGNEGQSADSGDASKKTKKKIEPHTEGGSDLIPQIAQSGKLPIRPSVEMKPVAGTTQTGAGSGKPGQQLLPSDGSEGLRVEKRPSLGGIAKRDLSFDLKKKGENSKSCDGTLSLKFEKDTTFSVTANAECLQLKGVSFTMTSTCDRSQNNWDTFEAAVANGKPMQIHFQGYLSDSENPEKLAGDDDLDGREKGIVTIGGVDFWYRASKKRGKGDSKAALEVTPVEQDSTQSETAPSN